ncbi:MAG: hypothetical protein RJB66_1145 [Pseudomonadota bacterium]|jgi:hypothetical protein
MRTLTDSFSSETSKEFVEQAVTQAFNRGLITKTENIDILKLRRQVAIDHAH